MKDLEIDPKTLAITGKVIWAGELKMSDEDIEKLLEALKSVKRRKGKRRSL
jgi:hypothetical protein